MSAFAAAAPQSGLADAPSAPLSSLEHIEKITLEERLRFTNEAENQSARPKKLAGIRGRKAAISNDMAQTERYTLRLRDDINGFRVPGMPVMQSQIEDQRPLKSDLLIAATLRPLSPVLRSRSFARPFSVL